MPQKAFDRFTLTLFLLGVLFGSSIGGVLGFAFARNIAPASHSEGDADGSLGLVKVVRVVDGDTIQVEGGEKIRYLGVNTPESTTKKECFGKEAAAKNREMVEGKTVRLEKGRRDRDKYGRLLRFVYVDGVFVNTELIRGGYAFAYMLEGSDRTPEFERAEREAKDAGRGMWKSCGYAKAGKLKR